MRRSPGTLALGIVLLTSFGPGGRIAGASTVVVPDNAATIQAGLGLADTVLVRSGSYPDPFLMYSPDGFPKAVLVYPGSPSAPVIGSATAEGFNTGSVLLTLRGLKCAAPVELRFWTYDTHVLIDSCAVDSGFDVSVADIEGYAFLTMTHTVFHGSFSGMFEDLTLDSDSLYDGVASNVGEGPTTVTHCVFVRSGIHFDADNGLVATGNRFEQCRCGILGGKGQSVISANTFTACAEGCSMQDPSSIDGNTFIDCGWGIASFSGDATITNNRILGSQIGIYAWEPDVEGNVVGRGVQGIHLLSGVVDMTVRHNTVFDNSGPGFLLEPAGNNTFHIDHNIGFGNRGYGLDCRGVSNVFLSCNDWFGNDSSAVIGVDPSPQDLAVDPQFCAVDSGDVHLSASSPLLDASGCGLIGALGQGCETTPTLVTAFTAERIGEGVRLTWSLGNPNRFPAVWLERSEGGSQSWARLALDVVTDGTMAVAVDGTALPDRAYSYRLTASSGGRVVVLVQPVTVAAESPLAFALQRISPNPSTGPLHVEFSLARAAFVSLDLYDVAGRRVAELARGSLSAGLHRVDWPGMASRNPGVYSLRYRYPGGAVTRSVIRVR